MSTEEEPSFGLEVASVRRRVDRDGRLLPGGRAYPLDLDHDPEGEWEVVVDFTRVGRRLVPSRLEVRPVLFEVDVPAGGITARLLHSIKLGELVDEFRREHAGDLEAERLFYGKTKEPGYTLPPPANRPGPRGLSEAFYQDVARAYLRSVRADPRRPIAHMTESYPGYSQQNIRDWVARARQKGYLEAPGQGRPGGEPTTKLKDAFRAWGAQARATGRGRGGRRRSSEA